MSKRAPKTGPEIWSRILGDWTNVTISLGRMDYEETGYRDPETNAYDTLRGVEVLVRGWNRERIEDAAETMAELAREAEALSAKFRSLAEGATTEREQQIKHLQELIAEEAPER